MEKKDVIAMDLSFEDYMDGDEFERSEDRLMTIIRTAYEAGYRAGMKGSRILCGKTSFVGSLQEGAWGRAPSVSLTADSSLQEGANGERVNQ